MKVIGYSKDYFVDRKYIGSLVCEKDRDVFGYYGRKEEVLQNDVVFRNKKKIKKGQLVLTELQQLNGRI